MEGGPAATPLDVQFVLRLPPSALRASAFAHPTLTPAQDVPLDIAVFAGRDSASIKSLCRACLKTLLALAVVGKVKIPEHAFAARQADSARSAVRAARQWSGRSFPSLLGSILGVVAQFGNAARRHVSPRLIEV